MHTTARLTFHHQTIAVHIDQILRQVMILKVDWAVFAMAGF